MSGSEDLSRAAELVELAVAEAGEDHDARANALYAGSIVDINVGRLDRAYDRLDEALGLFEQAGNAGGIADVWDARATAVMLGGDVRAAEQSHDRAARTFMESGELIRVVWPRASRGYDLLLMNQAEAGLQDLGEALELARTLGHPEGEAFCLLMQGEALADVGQTDDAVRCAREALAIAERIGHAEWTTGSLCAVGYALRMSGELNTAEAALRRALEIAEGHHLPFWTSWGAALLALVLVAQGDLEAAQPIVDLGLSVGTPLKHYEVRLARAQLAAARRDPDALRIAADALALAQTGGHLRSAARLEELVAELQLLIEPRTFEDWSQVREPIAPVRRSCA